MSIRRFAVRRTALAAAVTALAVGLLAPSAAAQEAVGSEPDMVNEEISATLLIDGNTTRLVDLQGITSLVDSLGRTIGSPRTVALGSEVSEPELGSYTCVYSGRASKKFTALPLREVYKDYGYGKVHAQFHTYRMKKARRVGFGKQRVRTTQFEVCGVGGGHMKDKRMLKMGLGIAYPDASMTYKIGSEWRSGETPENYTTNLSFEVPIHKAVTIGGGISQSPTNKLMGSFEPPFDSEASLYARNGVNAWWQDDCVGGAPCAPWKGSKSFHGTVAQGLFEFNPAQAATFRGFRLVTYLTTN
ncbi:MAG: hypothetical protein ACT4PP_06530 [Sporichthyaceae bacterium]